MPFPLLFVGGLALLLFRVAREVTKRKKR